MSVAYKPVIWNRTKLIYDACLLIGIGGYLALYFLVAPQLGGSSGINPAIVKMRAFGSCAFLLLTMILCIGPLARLDPRFLPVLYNRRHFGVITAVVALTHAKAVLDWYFAYAATPAVTALFTANTSYFQIAGFPFELFGVFALGVLVVMALTSHDFWMSFLTPPVWKTLHMAVYLAYAAVLLHVTLGALAVGHNTALTLVVAASAAVVITLHLLAGRREAARDAGFGRDHSGDWVCIGKLSDIAEGRAIIGAAPGGERIAVFRAKGRLSAMSNVCSHQNGPIGEGKVVGGFVTCPWHGYQYRLEDGCSPPPFKERLRKYRLRLEGDRVLVDPVALPLGTVVEPVPIPEGTA